MDDELSVMRRALLVDQIVLRALFAEVVKRLSEDHADPAARRRDILLSMQKLIDGHRVEGADEATLEDLREAARMNVDTMFRAFSGTNGPQR